MKTNIFKLMTPSTLLLTLSIVLQNTTNGNQTGPGLASTLAGNWGLIVGAVILFIGAFIFLFVLKHIIANAIVGIFALLIIKFLLGVDIPLSPFVILVSVLGGLGGVAAVLIGGFLGWL